MTFRHQDLCYGGELYTRTCHCAVAAEGSVWEQLAVYEGWNEGFLSTMVAARRWPGRRGICGHARRHSNNRDWHDPTDRFPRGACFRQRRKRDSMKSRECA
jgi:hypothetical protein